ncbi:DUF4139 domain-containing protein [Undibacterium sp.]|uniref:DUF4139 domain-containing protein n=1 Tax=Undibacterium sp. TaxID=1914977 RepID=UPI0025FB85D0|nr:DUF4139 domain-containing protein [Undibacterium sp.]
MKNISLAVLALLPSLALAQTPASKITQVLVYPGGAKVERAAKVAAGARELKLTCLPARFDLDSLQVQADAGIVIGDINVQTLERVRAPECATSPLDARIRELEDQKSAIAAEDAAQALVLGYLKNYGNDKPSGPIASTAEQLRRTGQDALQRQHQAQRRAEVIEKQLAPLIAERERLIAANPQVRTVQIRLAAQAEGELRLSYRLKQAGWTPVYRAYLDTNKSQLRLERHAQVAQTSGEDWTNVNLRLSTAQPNLANRINPPYPWTLDIRPPVSANKYEMQLAAAPAPMAKMITVTGSRRSADDEEGAPNFDVNVFQGEFAAEFVVPGKISLASDGQRGGFALGNQTLEAQIKVHVQPQQEAQAYLLAELTRPAGSWPTGNLQLFRDGDFVGQSQLRMDSEERMELFFGRDEMVRVQTEPEQRDAANKGFIGSRAEQKIGHAYVLENLHKKAITLQVLESSPVARHEDIRVQTQFSPKPAQDTWHKQPGIIAWQLPLEAGKSLRLTADYVISYPKDAIVNGLR